jgi:hypothetical protein
VGEERKLTKDDHSNIDRAQNPQLISFFEKAVLALLDSIDVVFDRKNDQ